MTTAVTQSEAQLLLLARSAVGLVPTADVMRLLAGSVSPPAQLGPTARRLLADTLGRGTVLALARQGGWRGAPGGRLWERHVPPALHFSGAIVRLFQWLLRTPLSDGAVAPFVSPTPLTLAESLVVTLLLDQLRGTGWDIVLARQAPVRAAPLVVLAHVAELARAAPLEALPQLDLAELTLAIDGLRGLLARSWLSGERLKRDLADPGVLRRVGEAQRALLGVFLDTIDAAGQRGLATFLIDAGVEWLRAPPRSAEELVRSLSHDTPLRDRSEARKASAAFLRGLDRLRTWDREHRAVRFIDDGYEVAQALISDWGRLGEPGFQLAASLVTQLEALPAAEAATPSPD
jgi:hypothetical protein